MLTFRHIFIFFLFYHYFLATIAYLRVSKLKNYAKETLFAYVCIKSVPIGCDSPDKCNPINPSQAHKN